MLTREQIPAVIQATAYDPSGEKIGAVKQVYLDDRTDQPQFATVHTGLFGLKETFVPLSGAELNGDRVVVPVAKDQVKDAPNIDPDGSDGALTPTQAAELYRHYQVPSQASGTRDAYRVRSGSDDDATIRDEVPGERGRGSYQTRGESGRERSAGTGYAAGSRGGTGGGSAGDDDAMTRSEERLNVGTERQEAGRARLRKYVETEQVQKTVPVTREEVRVEREPITEANRDAAFSGPAISEAEHEVTLHEENPVVEKEAVPVERVRLGKEQVTEERTVGDTVRKERIDTDGDRL
jgi:uncharacterized protein (TIGR02271 family)